ncbi:MAG TPA: PAS domain S-box protein [Candidatus Kryptonia bacterium]|nr:PAS domain S-box protein [Candidatus Kryptonia bacterium]
MTDFRAAIRAHQQDILIARGRLIGWSTIVGILVLWALGASRPLASIGSPLPLLNIVELCILTVAVVQLHRAQRPRHIVDVATAVCVQMAGFLALYGLWTGNLWLLALRLTTLNLVTAAVLPWGIAMQAIVMATSTVAFAFVHWSLNATFDHPSTVPTLILFVFSLPLAAWLNQAHAELATEIERRRTAESVLRQATESAAVAVWDVDLRTRTARLISGWERLLAREEHEIPLAAVFDLVHADDRAATTVALTEYLQGRASTYEVEQRLLRADGSYRWVLSRGVAAHDAAGQPYRMLGAVIDITDRKRLEAALQDIEARKHVEEMLRESEERFRATFEQAAVGIAHVALDGRWLRVNRRLCDIVGYTEQELWARTFQDLTHPDDLDRDLNYVRDMLDGKLQTYSMEKRYFRKDGSIAWADLTVSLVREPSGRPKYFISVVQDIAARKQAENERERLFLFLNSIVENIPDMVFVKDAKSLKFVLFNRAGEQLLGYRRADLIGKNDYDLFPKAEADFFTGKDRAVLRDKTLLDIPEEPIATAQGGERTLHTKKFPILDGRGEPVYLLGISEDITDRHHVEQMRHRHERETTMVNDILRAINTHLDVKAAFPAVCAGLRELAECAAVSLNLFDERREWLTFVAADAPWALHVGPDVRLSATEFPSVPDILAGHPHIVPDLATEVQFPLVRLIYDLGFRSVISLPLSVGSDVVGFLNLFWREVDGCHASEIGLLNQVTSAVAIAVEKSRLFEQVSAGRERLALLSRRLMEVQEAERRHLARELHDEIGQYLTGVSLILGDLERRSLDTAQVPLRDAHKLVDDLIVRVRDLSLDLRPAMLDDLGLLPALLWLFERFSKQTNLDVDFHHIGLDRRFPHDVETAAYRIVQEALTNVARHAGVSRVLVRVSADHDRLSVVIADQGKGFDAEAVLATAATSGLSGMRERATLAGGRLRVESGLEAGTRVRAEFDLNTAERSDHERR